MRCCKQVASDGSSSHFHQCTREGILEHDGRMYCKTHHPPSIAARKKVQPKCSYRYDDNSICGTRVPEGTKYCRFHLERVQLEFVAEKAAAYDRIQYYVETCNGVLNFDHVAILLKLDVKNKC